MTDRLEIRSYARIFDSDRRVYRVEQWTLPVPGGVSLRALAWFGGSLLAVILLGSLPLVADALELVPASPALPPAPGGYRGPGNKAWAGRADAGQGGVGVDRVPDPPDRLIHDPPAEGRLRT
jgi:hypothetical protein